MSVRHADRHPPDGSDGSGGSGGDAYGTYNADNTFLNLASLAGGAMGISIGGWVGLAEWEVKYVTIPEIVIGGGDLPPGDDPSSPDFNVSNPAADMGYGMMDDALGDVGRGRARCAEQLPEWRTARRGQNIARNRPPSSVPPRNRTLAPRESQSAETNHRRSAIETPYRLGEAADKVGVALRECERLIRCNHFRNSTEHWLIIERCVVHCEANRAGNEGGKWAAVPDRVRPILTP